MPDEVNPNPNPSETPDAEPVTVEQLRAELERNKAALKAANRESAERRVRLAELEATETKRKEAEMTETQRLQKIATDAEAARDAAIQSAHTTLIKAAFIAEAAKLGALHPEDAYALSDQSGVTLADGKVSGAAEAVKALVEAKRLPTAGNGRAPDLNAGAGGGQKPDPTTQPTTEEIAAAKKTNVPIDAYMKAKAGITR